MLAPLFVSLKVKRIYFDNFSGRERAAKYFYNEWHKALRAAKLVDYRSHDLRRGTAIRRDNAGISQDSNMKLGGWKTPAMLQRYLKGKSVEDLRTAVNLLATVTKPLKNRHKSEKPQAASA